MKKLIKRLSKSFTDSLYFANLFITWIFVIWCSLLTVFGDNWGVQDYSLIMCGLPLVFAELGVHTGFIIWKAKSENIAKHDICMEEIENELDC